MGVWKGKKTVRWVAYAFCVLVQPTDQMVHFQFYKGRDLKTCFLPESDLPFPKRWHNICTNIINIEELVRYTNKTSKPNWEF
jgi:hypothetical protein